MKWVLILMLKYGYAGGVTQIEYFGQDAYQQCKVGLAQVKRMDSHIDSSCIEVKYK